jgi:hypothetical protein
MENEEGNKGRCYVVENLAARLKIKHVWKSVPHDRTKQIRKRNHPHNQYCYIMVSSSKSKINNNHH